ncbi:MAG TPA: hypothetical protein VL524_15705 [Gemmatimonadaceae bacterium]|nr:hypothetical protein [Gemmatimonadaceae bacterium]
MRLFLAARGSHAAACWLSIVVGLVRAGSTAGAQVWNDPRSLALARTATQRRAEQLADTGLTDYRASAHGYVTFLAQLGEGFRTPPKVIKADELELEVYWRTPNLSKQRIIGRRDTLLLPTDIAYHRDHLGIVQNNFPDIIRLGEGDEVRDVPHPLSPRGLADYDFALTDSFSIGAANQRIRVYELKVRPKDDRQPRVVGAVYIDPSGGQVVRMNFGFTRAAFLDDALEQLTVVLENRLVAGRFWLPSEQRIEIERTGSWMDYPVRGIIRGRWEIGDYQINTSVSPAVFAGQEIVQAPPAELKRYKWTGQVLDSLPPDVRAVEEPDIQRVQAEVHALVRGQALARARKATLAARNLSDMVRVDRVEGLAVGGGVSKAFGGGVSANVRARYGVDDRLVKGAVGLTASSGSGASTRVFASRDFRDVGDVAERSTSLNSIAAQEFGSDYTDPYLVRAVGASLEGGPILGFSPRFTASYEWQSALAVRARPVTGTYEPTIATNDRHASRWLLEANRAPGLWLAGTELGVHAEARVRRPYQPDAVNALREATTVRGALSAEIERPFGDQRLVTATTIAGVVAGSSAPLPSQELVYVGGPRSLPGYAYHAFASSFAATEHVEWQIPAPFVPFSLGRFGRVPARGAIAPYVHAAVIGAPVASCERRVVANSATSSCSSLDAGVYPSLGAAYVFPFDVIRIDVARGLGRAGRWTFNVDVSRDFWSIL